jgi:glycine cleavage system H protein
MKFTDSHEWIRVENGKGIVGITRFAREELGPVVYLELPAVGVRVKAGEEAAVLESTKAAADVYAPVSGEVTAVNERLRAAIGALNTDPEGEGWLFEVTLSHPSELEELLDREKYLTLVRSG